MDSFERSIINFFIGGVLLWRLSESSLVLGYDPILADALFFTGLTLIGTTVLLVLRDYVMREIEHREQMQISKAQLFLQAVQPHNKELAKEMMKIPGVLGLGFELHRDFDQQVKVAPGLISSNQLIIPFVDPEYEWDLIAYLESGTAESPQSVRSFSNNSAVQNYASQLCNLLAELGIMLKAPGKPFLWNVNRKIFIRMLKRDYQVSISSPL